MPTASNGGVIGDGILFHEGEDEFVYVGRAPGANWLQFHAETGGYDVEIRYDDRSPSRPYGAAVNREYYRFQIQGPNAWPIIEKLNGGTLEQGALLPHGRDDGRRRAGAHPAPRHGGRPGSRAVGTRTSSTARSATRSSRPAASSASSRAGRARTRRTRSSRAGSPRRCRRSTRARASAPTASGCPRTATRRSTRSPARSSRTTSRTTTSTRGSSATARSSSSTTTSSAATRSRRSIPTAQRKKVTLAWNDEDLAKLLTTPIDRDGTGYQFFDLPNANYGSSNYDAVIDADGNTVGLSLFTGVTANEKRGLSLATVDARRADRRRGARRLGRARRRLAQDDRRAARAARRPRDRQPGAVRRSPRAPSTTAAGARRRSAPEDSVEAGADAAASPLLRSESERLPATRTGDFTEAG